MIRLRFAIVAVLAAAVAAGCFTYLLVATPAFEADRRLPPDAPDKTGTGVGTPNIGQLPSAEEQAAAAFQRATAAILRRAQNAQASAAEPLINGRIPLPKRRPLPRP
jgi:hypothetical protein